jgi:flagellar biosynthesis protein FlhA
VLANLLREGISIRDIGTILEILGDYGTIIRDPDTLTEYVRQNLKRAITHKFIPDGKARVITLDPALEHQIGESIHKSEQGSYAVLEPAVIQKILIALKSAVEHFLSLGITPIVLTTPQIRKDFKRLTVQLDPDITVLSYNEIEQHVEIFSDKVVKI